MCQGAAMTRKTTIPESGRSRFQVCNKKIRRVTSKYSMAVATGKTTPTRLFNNMPRARLAKNSHDQNFACRSSSSKTRRKAHMARVMVKVSITSGIRTRVKSQSPIQVAITSPALKPAFLPKAHLANAAVTQASPMAVRAKGILAAQSWIPSSW